MRSRASKDWVMMEREGRVTKSAAHIGFRDMNADKRHILIRKGGTDGQGVAKVAVQEVFRTIRALKWLEELVYWC